MHSNHTKKRSLILCATPFQILIAEKIIKQNPDSDFDLILTFNKNENRQKFEYYFNRIKHLCKKALFWEYKAKISNLIKFKIKIHIDGFNEEYDELYLSNVHRAHFQLLVSYNIDSKIFTFDDGLANILPSSKLYIDNELDIVRRSIWKVLGIHVSSEDIKNKSSTHLTVYKNIPNIINNTSFIDLYDRNLTDALDENQEIIKIYLGQPLNEVGKAFEKTNIKKIFDSLGIQKYFPHPREKTISIKDIEIIKTKLIFEDYIIELLNSDSNICIEVYSFFSSAIINIASFNRVKCYYIYHQYVDENHKDIYEISSMFPNIEIIKV